MYILFLSLCMYSWYAIKFIGNFPCVCVCVCVCVFCGSVLWLLMLYKILLATNFYFFPECVCVCLYEFVCFCFCLCVYSLSYIQCRLDFLLSLRLVLSSNISVYAFSFVRISFALIFLFFCVLCCYLFFEFSWEEDFIHFPEFLKDFCRIFAFNNIEKSYFSLV